MDEKALHKAIVQALVDVAPAGCAELLFEFLCADDGLELTVVPEAAARALPDAFTQAVLNLIAHLERDGQRVHSGRYRVLLTGADAQFDASFGFRAS